MLVPRFESVLDNDRLELRGWRPRLADARDRERTDDRIVDGVRP